MEEQLAEQITEAEFRLLALPAATLDGLAMKPRMRLLGETLTGDQHKAVDERPAPSMSSLTNIGARENAGVLLDIERNDQASSAALLGRARNVWQADVVRWPKQFMPLVPTRIQLSGRGTSGPSRLPLCRMPALLAHDEGLPGRRRPRFAEWDAVFAKSERTRKALVRAKYGMPYGSSADVTGKTGPRDIPIIRVGMGRFAPIAFAGEC